tara:strand:+ start:26439 stop:27221 length:783 start_codon:yes stop_codon:yes gene_type:complete
MPDIAALGLSAWQIVVIALALFLSGVIKGATGAGTPILAVPVMAAVVDVRFAILTMLMPNLLTNIWQAFRFREHQPERQFLWKYVIAGGLGVAAGTLVLATVDTGILSIVVSLSVLVYVGIRLSRPNWSLSLSAGKRLAVPAGLAAGILQGSTGLAAPALLSFLNALRLERLTFVATVSLVFVTFSVVHTGSLAIGGFITMPAILISFLAVAPIAVGMSVGTRILALINAATFDRTILGLLTVIAVWNIVQAVMRTLAGG